MMRTESLSSDRTAVTTNHPTLTRLLMVRELAEVDPAPEMPRATPLPSAVHARLGTIPGDESEAWRSHWGAIIDQLSASTPPDSGHWALWPEHFPEPTDAGVTEWAVKVDRPLRGTPLSQHPSQRYYMARTRAIDLLPERIVVLPLAGRWSGRHGSDVGYLSVTQYLDPADAAYGFNVA